MKNIFTILITCIQLCAIAYTQPGTLDSTFDHDGKVTTKGKLSEVYSIAIQPGGKIVTAGYASYAVFALLRYKTDGSIDESFGSNGMVTTPINDNYSVINDIKIKSDGSIIAAGYTQQIHNKDFALAYYNSKGKLDSSFGKKGIVITNAGSKDDVINEVALQDDGKIVAAGSNGNFVLARYFYDGKIDSSFGVNGMVETAFKSGSSANALAIQSDGKIVVTGSYYDTTLKYDFIVLRYTKKGILDNSFGTNGIVTTNFGSQEYSTAVAIQPDGKIVVGGFQNKAKKQYFAIARYKPDGNLDKGFGIKGKVITSFGNNDYNAITTIIIKPDGNIVASGNVAPILQNEFGIAQYKPDGELDSAFGINGTTTIDFHKDHNIWEHAAALQSDDKLVIAGNIDASNIALARYKGDSSLQLTSYSNSSSNLEEKVDRYSSMHITQNVPNPFNHITTIGYTLPQTYSSAKIVVTDKSGKALKEINVSSKGKGSLSIDASTLAVGAYQYSLIIDGKVIDTKQMMIAK